MLFLSKKTCFDCFFRFKLLLSVGLLLLISISLPVSSLAELPGGESYTLVESVAQALKSSPRVLGSEYALEGAEAEVMMARGQMLPALTLSGGRSYVREESSSGQVDTDYLDQHSDTLSMKVTQTLFAGLTLLNSYQRAQLKKEYKAAEKESVEDRLILEVQTVFFDLVKARGDVRTLTDSADRLRATVESVRSFTEVRLAPYVDLLQAESDLADTLQLLSKARIAVINLNITLNTLLGLDVDASVNYVGDFNDQHFAIPWSLEECLEQAMEQRADLKVARLGMEMAEKAAEVVYGRKFPKVDLQIGYVHQERAYDDDLVSKFRDYSTDYWTAGVNMQWQLFDGFYNHYEQRSALSEVGRLRETLRDTHNQVKAQVAAFFQTLQESRERIEATLKGLELARESLQRGQVRFAARVGTIIELLDAQARLTRAETSNSQAMAEYQQILANLLYSIGERNPALRF